MPAQLRTVGKVIRVTAPSPSTWSSPRLVSGLALLLLGLYWWQAVSASTHWSQTSDELAHVTAGYAADRYGDFRLQPENGCLPQRVHGLSPWLLGAKLPSDLGLWQRSQGWQIGWEFLYQGDNPTDRLLLGARALNALFGVGLGLFIFVVARRWYGDGGGLLALGFYAFSPDFLAHGPLATSDLAVALLLPLASWCFWRHLTHRDLRSGLLAGLVTGLALVAKFNGLLLIPIYVLLAFAEAGRHGQRGAAGRVLRNAGLGLGQALAGGAIIWAFYGFRFALAGPGLPAPLQLPWPWPYLLDHVGGLAGPIRLALSWQLLPEAWLYGLTNVLGGATARAAFFAGEYRDQGWWEFFPTLFLVKTPLAMLAGLAVALGLGLRQRRHSAPGAGREALFRWLPVAVPAAVVWATALTGHLNIGQRHILAAYPALFIALGGLARVPRRWLLLPVLLLAAQATESWLIRPHYLSYFNALAGGPAPAYRLVVDSSLDWGQDLPALRDWLGANRRPAEPVYLGYFGSAWPPHYGVRPTWFLPVPALARPPLQPYELSPGLYCLSATTLAQVYSDYRGPWRPEWEQRWTAPMTDYAAYDGLRFARLCKYLQRRAPDAQAGFSILIYRLDAAELRAALSGPVRGW
jgi:hypothetical protein